MKPYPIALALAFCICFSAIAQEKESFYVFDADWKPTKIENAKILLRLHQQNDTCWQYDYYQFTGPLIKTIQYRDHEGKIPHGEVRYYTPGGALDSAGNYVQGLKHGWFVKYRTDTDTLKYLAEYRYEYDSLVATTDLTKKDTTRYGDEKESEYPGGLSRWGYFLTKNLQYPDRAVKGNLQGTVRVLFMVDAEGAVHNPYIAKSVEYSLDTESLRMIKKSGRWTPAFQNGRLVKSYKLQPITYRLQ